MEDEPKNEYCPSWGYRQHLHTRNAGWTTFIIPKGYVWARIDDFEVMIFKPLGFWGRIFRLLKGRLKRLATTIKEIE